jgi:hypothetical protein
MHFTESTEGWEMMSDGITLAKKTIVRTHWHGEGVDSFGMKSVTC